MRYLRWPSKGNPAYLKLKPPTSGRVRFGGDTIQHAVATTLMLAVLFVTRLENFQFRKLEYFLRNLDSSIHIKFTKIHKFTNTSWKFRKKISVNVKDFQIP